MAQLVETDLPLPAQVFLRPGDVLVVRAAGGHLRNGGGTVEMMGPFSPASLQANGAVLSPMGSPGTVLFRALRPGRAAAEVVTGDPWFSTENTAFEIVVEP